MKQNDLINLFKFLQCTMSNNDAEVVAVMRKVNMMLMRTGKTWENVYAMCQAPASEAPPEASDKSSGWEEDVIDLPLAMLEKNVNERFKQAGLTQFEAQLKRNK